VTKILVSGGNLDHNNDLDILSEKGGSELIILLLNKSGKVCGTCRNCFSIFADYNLVTVLYIGTGILKMLAVFSFCFQIT